MESCLHYGHEKVHVFLHPLHRQQLQMQTPFFFFSPLFLSKLQLPGQSQPPALFPTSMEGCDFPSPPGLQALHAGLQPVHVPASSQNHTPKAVICVQQCFLFPRVALNYGTAFPQEVTQGNQFTCSACGWGILSLEHATTIHFSDPLTSSSTHPHREAFIRSEEHKKGLFFFNPSK